MFEDFSAVKPDSKRLEQKTTQGLTQCKRTGYKNKFKSPLLANIYL